MCSSECPCAEEWEEQGSDEDELGSLLLLDEEDEEAGEDFLAADEEAEDYGACEEDGEAEDEGPLQAPTARPAAVQIEKVYE